MSSAANPRSPDYNLRSVRLFDARLEAHVDALVVGRCFRRAVRSRYIGPGHRVWGRRCGPGVGGAAEERGIDLRPLFEKVPDAVPRCTCGA